MMVEGEGCVVVGAELQPGVRRPVDVLLEHLVDHCKF